VIRNIIILMSLMITLISGTRETLASSSDNLENSLRNEISKNYTGARIDLLGDIQWVRGSAPEEPQSIFLLGDDGQGRIHFTVTNNLDNGSSEGWVGFAAWVPVRVVKRRVHPGEVLTSDMFTTQNVNVAVGQAREYRGVMFPQNVEINGMEAHQTILEGQFLTSSAVQRIPDIHRGDPVRVHLISGDLVLSTLAIAQESGYLKQQIRVMTNKGKRELFGMLQQGRIVEVKL
jgi:flagella basal body P-ring formation protein FlgA